MNEQKIPVSILKLDGDDYICDLCYGKENTYRFFSVAYPDGTAKYTCRKCREDIKKTLHEEKKLPYFLTYIPDYVDGAVSLLKFFNSEDEVVAYLISLLGLDSMMLAYDTCDNNEYAVIKLNKNYSFWWVLGYTSVDLSKYGIPDWTSLRVES